LQGHTAGSANAIQIAAFIVGMLAGGGGLLVLHAQVGWAVAMQLLALLLTLLYLPLALLLQKSRQGGRADTALHTAQRVRLRDLLQHMDLGWALTIALLFKFASTAVSTLVQPWLIDRGLSLTQVGALQMSNLTANAVGAVLIGIPLVRCLGNRRAVLVGYVLATTVLGTAWGLQASDVQDIRMLYAAFAVQSLVEGAMFVTIWALFMNWASPQRPGTDFTAMQCCENLSNSLAMGVIAGLGQSLGYSRAFALTWLAGGLTVVLIAWCLPRLTLCGEARAR